MTALLLQFTASVGGGAKAQARNHGEAGRPSAVGGSVSAGLWGARGLRGSAGTEALLSGGQSGGVSKREATFHPPSLLFPPRQDLTGGCSQRAVLHL